MNLISRRAFTLIELLVVMAVVSILAAILYPVFTQVKQAAVQASCASRFRQVTQAGLIYLGDYDDVFMPINHEPGAPPNAKTDRTWVQMLLPYTGSFRTFRCPADSVSPDQTVGVFDQDLVPGDLFARYYSASMHVNVGYNFQYLAPILRSGQAWTAQPKSMSELADPSQMLLLIDSAWDVQDGNPVDGGSWLVSPPCRYQSVDGKVLDTITDTVSSVSMDNLEPKSDDGIFAPVAGWQTTSPTGSQYGGAWPWHMGRLTVALVGGNAPAITIAQLGSGCQILPSWSGSIEDRHQYLWSPK